MRQLVMFVLVFSLFATAASATDLIITGVCDGPITGGIPKAIEVKACADIADLSIYGISSANNGGGPTGAPEFTFPADSAVEGQYIYIASEDVAFPDFFGFAPDYTSGMALINGDDAIELFMNGGVVDVFGDVDVDGSGTAWDYQDGWAYRIDQTGPDGSTFVLANWTYSGVNGLEGGTTNDTCTVPFPLGTYECPGASAIDATTWGMMKALYR